MYGFDERPALSRFGAVLRYVIPPPADRLPRSAETASYYLIPFILLLVMAGLARRPGTWALRLAIFPFAVAAVLRGAYGFVYLDPQQVGANQAFGSSSCASKVCHYSLNC